jgi:endonuclease/exonuclease/phosphatase family metal-dependent hydrolase
MRRLRVTTWNVLHRVHAMNWHEAPVATFPDERERTAAIATLVGEWFADGVDAVCLQEVSGDQLVALRRASSGVQVFDHVYPRLPRVRIGGAAPLDDPTEHLVTLVAGAVSARQAESRTFDSDPGKGFLAVELEASIRLISTHVSFGGRSAKQLAAVLAAASEGPGGAIVVGDFNAPADALRVAFCSPFALCDLTGERPTRDATPDHPGRTIDHVLARGGVIEIASVLDGRGLSDHAPVTSSVRFD